MVNEKHDRQRLRQYSFSLALGAFYMIAIQEQCKDVRN